MTADRRRRRGLVVGGAIVAVLGLAVAAGLAGLPASSDDGALGGDPHPPSPGMELVLDEQFDGSALDASIWNTCHWWAIGGCTIASNDELEWYLPGNVTVADGRLRLEARAEPTTSPDGDTFPYSSGMVASGPPFGDEDLPAKFAFTYGYVEARLRIPSDTGLWPAFWLLPADEESKPEIDVLETVGDDTTTARFHYHYLDEAGEEQSLGADWSGPDLAAGWHTFAVDWRPDEITWIVDGRERWRIEGSIVSDEPMYVVLNLAVGGVYPGPPDDDTEFPAALEADWIRVYQTDGGQAP